jgi:hypothetical protein
VNPRHVGVFLQVVRKASRGEAMTHRGLKGAVVARDTEESKQLPESRSHLSCNLPLFADIGKKIEIEHALSQQ